MPSQYQEKPIVGQIQVTLRDRLIKNFFLRGDLSAILRYLEARVEYSENLEFQVYALLSQKLPVEVGDRYIIRPLIPQEEIPTGV